MDSAVGHSLESVREWLLDCVAGYAGKRADEIGPDVPLSEYGLDSVSALTVCVDIEDRYGLPLEPTVMWDHPTVEALAVVLTEQLGQA